MQEQILSVECTRPSILKPPKPEYKKKLHVSKRASCRHKKHHKDSARDSGSHSHRNELSITAKPCYIDYNHRPYSEDAKPCTNIKQKLVKSRLAALLELRKYANSLQHPSWDNHDNTSQITYQTHYIHEKSQPGPTTSSSAITIMEPWILFN